LCSLTAEEVEKLKMLIADFLDVFALSDEELGVLMFYNIP